MAAIHDIKAVFFAEVIARVARLAGDIGIDASGNGLRQKKRPAASHHRNALNRARAKKIGADIHAERVVKSIEKFSLRNSARRLGNVTDVSPVMAAKSCCRLESQAPRQHRIVTEFGMRIERQMRAIKVDAGVDEFFDAPIMRADNFFRLLPKQAVMNDQQIDIGGGRGVDGFLTDIDRRGDTMNLLASLHLQAVLRIVDKISELQISVEVIGKVFEVHGEKKSEVNKVRGQNRALFLFGCGLLAFVFRLGRLVPRQLRVGSRVISGARQHRQPRIFRKARILLRKPAQIKRAAATGADDPDVVAGLAKADRVMKCAHEHQFHAFAGNSQALFQTCYHLSVITVLAVNLKNTDMLKNFSYFSKATARPVPI